MKKKTSNEENLSERECKQRWNASLPYPLWPFGTVPPRQLAKLTNKNAPPEGLADALM